MPSLRIKWDQNFVKITPNEARAKLKNGHPSIETVGSDQEIGITTWMMEPGQERLVASRLKEILSNT